MPGAGPGPCGQGRSGSAHPFSPRVLAAENKRKVRSNLHATEALLAACRAAGTRPLVVFSSSIAVFGGSPELPLPAVVEDHTLPNPQTSYGIQKLIGEQLLADYTRKGFLRGRASG